MKARSLVRCIRGNTCSFTKGLIPRQWLQTTFPESGRSPSCIKDTQRFASSSSLGIEHANAGVFQDLRTAYKSEELNILQSLQARYPDWTVTMTPASTGLLELANAGHAVAKLDIESQKLVSRLKYEPAKKPEDQDEDEPDAVMKSAGFREAVNFGRYDYHWNNKSFIVYLLCENWGENAPTHHLDKNVYFILTRRDGDEITMGRSSAVKDLISAASSHTNAVHEEDVLVFDDDQWKKNTRLWKSVQQIGWDDVILDPTLKKALLQDVEGFFEQEHDYKQFGVAWKRGIILHGLPGNGKTMTVKALMHGLSSRPKPIPTLYVKSAEGDYGEIYAIRKIFKKARNMSPCLLVFEDLDSIITEKSRSFFLNEVDGLESNDGIMMIGSTNYLEKLDAGITKRPSRFDRKYHFDLPGVAERTRYCEYWRSKMAENQAVDFPARMCSAIAEITDGFSFAYLQEAFISSLLVLVNSQREGVSNERSQKPVSEILESVVLWRVMNKQVEMLRNEIKGSRKSAEDAMKYNGPRPAAKAGFA